MNGGHPAEDPLLTRFIAALQAETRGRRVLAVASVDLAHVGPNFGDAFVMDIERRATLADSDRSLMEAVNQGDAERFYQEIAGVEDRNRICGFSSIYLMLRYLGPTSGLKVAYEHCPADAEDHSLVSICGLLLQ
jgi:AmmeMemoRadiSam system protein B